MSANRCYVNVLKTYFGKLPEAAFQQDVFYWRPKSKVEDKDYHLPWFEERVIAGKLVLGNMVKNMVKESGLGCTNKTNHSLRATGATRMFEANVPEKLVKERTGRHSSKSLEVYQKTSAAQEKAVTRVLNSTKKYAEVLQSQDKISGVKKEDKRNERFPLQSVENNFPTFSELYNCTFNFNFLYNYIYLYTFSFIIHLPISFALNKLFCDLIVNH